MSLDYKIDNTVRFSDQVEHKNLYSWCLREFDNAGRQIGGDQIPWRWGLNFSVADLIYSLGFRREKNSTLSKNQEPHQTLKESSVKRESLYGRLIPEKSGPSAFKATQYSFFGTDRTISEFTIRIVEAEEEAASVWGSLEHDSEVDFVNETHPDFLQINLVLKRDHFRPIAELVKSKSIDQASLYLSGVDGCYSNWNPGISANDIKILPSGSADGMVCFPDEKERAIPKLGEVKEFDLSFICKGTTPRNSNDRNDENFGGPKSLNDQDLTGSKDDEIISRWKKQTAQLDKINKVLIGIFAIAVLVALKLFA